MSQTSVQTNMDVGQAGLLADLSPKTSETKAAVTEALPFGRGLVKDTNSGEIKLPSAGGDKFVGVAMHSHNVEQDPIGSLGVGEYKVGAAVNSLVRGKIWVEVESLAAIEEDADVYVRHTAGGGGSVLGIFRTDADTASALQVLGARWTGVKSSAATVKLAVLDLNLPA